jgi:hypothetical protein
VIHIQNIAGRGWLQKTARFRAVIKLCRMRTPLEKLQAVVFNVSMLFQNIHELLPYLLAQHHLLLGRDAA